VFNFHGWKLMSDLLRLVLRCDRSYPNYVMVLCISLSLWR
jgi:hypothetical protein